MRRLSIVLAAIGLAACQTGPSPSSSSNSDAAQDLYTHLTEAVRTCWFAGDPAFTAYNYSPEINARSARILIVSKKAPNGLPLLVIEPKGAAVADVYGPLLDGPAGARIRADAERWIKGSSNCS